jgi:dienelactone hydrolase
MSPEQAQGQKVDARSDIFSFGSVLYEMLTGRRAFRRDSPTLTMAAILYLEPPSMESTAPDLEKIIARCLRKDPDRRFQHMEDVKCDLTACAAARATSGLSGLLRRPLAAALILITLLIPASWFAVRSWRVRWVRNTALPEIARLVEKQQLLVALHLARQAEQYVPDDPQLARFRREAIAQMSFRTTPSGAKLYVRDYEPGDTSEEWSFLGATPLDNVDLPYGFYRYKLTKSGFALVEGTFNSGPGTRTFTLHRLDTAPADMVWVAGGMLTFPTTAPAPLRDFWMDKYEVTNRQFKDFVDRGGYQNPRFWKHALVKGGRTLTWEQAMTEFRDSTGRPGPATWEFGTFPEGHSDHPVGGVSWYEAAAYAEFAGKNLPTVYHWMQAAGLASSAESVRLSNFLSKGPAPVGSFQGISTYGNYDLAGNLKEWAWNQAGDRRYSLGGAWNEASYLFQIPDAHQPFNRLPTQGFRCARYAEPLDPLLLGPVRFITRDRTHDKPAGDELFQTYKNLHSYDKTELKASVASPDPDSEHWHREKISFAAAYADERVTAHLFLPKNASPPYQTVIYFPGAGALLAPSGGLELGRIEFVVRSGRAVLYPIYKGMYERGPGAYYHRLGKPNLWREMNIQWSKDLGRSIDYLETRADIDHTKLAFYGSSLGAAQAPRLVAVEPRIKAAILLQGGFFEQVPAEVDPLHFAPRVHVPVLMLNGRDDFLFPLETSQLPLFRLLGTPPAHKRHVLYNGGHNVFDLQVIREILDWLDRYFGPAGAATGPAAQAR